jgi:hypothetical protein
MIVERLRAVIAAAENLPFDKQEQLAVSRAELIDALQWEAFFSSADGQNLVQAVAEAGEKHLQTGEVEEMREHWGE